MSGTKHRHYLNDLTTVHELFAFHHNHPHFFKGESKRHPYQTTMARFSSMRNIAVLLLGVLLVLYISRNKIPSDQQSYHHQQKHLDIEVLKVKNGNSTYNNSSQCQQNMDAANITGFNSLSREIQDFLYYRHCRHFPMILDLPDKCGDVDQPKDVFLLLVIKSPPQNYKNREVLRKTWAKERLQNGVWIRRIFISGTFGTDFEKEKLNKVLVLEHAEYNDILQWDFNESLFNLTLKQILFLEWMERKCQHASFLFNGDDDIFAHTDNMVEYLQSLEDNTGSKHLFAGQVIKHAKPIRNPASKYFIPVQVHESNSYPSYCGGGGYLLSSYTSLVIYTISKTLTILPIDDVFMAMCLEAANLGLTDHAGFKTLEFNIPNTARVKFDPCFLRDQLVIHRFPPIYIYVTWQELHHPDVDKCKVLI